MNMLSIIVPVFNEEENLQKVYTKLNSALKEKYSFEIIFVNDCSTDSSLKIIKELSKNKSVRFFSHEKRMGQSSAINTGIKEAKGDILITFDADLQYNPKEISLLLKKLENNDFVYGIRVNRKKTELFMEKVLPSKIANFLVNLFFHTNFKDFACSFRAFKKDAVKKIDLSQKNIQIYLSLIVFLQNKKIGNTKVSLYPRMKGESKYSFIRLPKGLIDLIFLKIYSVYFLNLKKFLILLLISGIVLFFLLIFINNLFLNIFIILLIILSYQKTNEFRNIFY